jgi:hypothetical protein
MSDNDILAGWLLSRHANEAAQRELRRRSGGRGPAGGRRRLSWSRLSSSFAHLHLRSLREAAVHARLRAW